MSGVLTGVQSLYRYRLTRSDFADCPWLAVREPALLWIMLNPSTADESLDDPTIRRVRAFTRRLGFGQFTVVNLYAWRSTDPRHLWTAADPVGPANDAAIADEAFTAVVDDAPIVAAWGAHARPERVEQVLAIPHVAARLHCLGITASGAPRHPLYLRGDAPLVRWTGNPA